jgi:hypothetical protein
VATPCTASVPKVDLTGWARVQARGFTYCVPPDWHGSGSEQRRGQASITWGTGQPPVRTASVTRVVKVRAGDPLPPPPDQLSDADTRRFSESIGGADADLYENRVGLDYYTGATWDSMSIYFQGEAHDRSTAELEVTIFRTVRFTTK